MNAQTRNANRRKLFYELANLKGNGNIKAATPQARINTENGRGHRHRGEAMTFNSDLTAADAVPYVMTEGT